MNSAREKRHEQVHIIHLGASEIQHHWHSVLSAGNERKGKVDLADQGCIFVTKDETA